MNREMIAESFEGIESDARSIQKQMDEGCRTERIKAFLQSILTSCQDIQRQLDKE